MPIFPFLSFLLFGNGKEDEEKKEGKALLFSDFFHLNEDRGERRKEQEFWVLALKLTCRKLS